MARVQKILGVQKLKRELAREKKASERGIERGLLRGGLFLQRESQKIVPVDTGALKNSARTTKKGSGKHTEVTVSYNTHYAIFVHENLYARHKPGKTAKYLEKPYNEKREEIIRIIRDEAAR